MMLTTRFVTGAPNWIDLGTPDIAGATAFYRALFGWEFQSAGPEAGGYGFFQLDGKTVAGGMQSTEGQGPPSWTVSFQTPDADTTAKAAEQAGGGTPAPPMDVMDAGRMAILTDTTGAVFGLWQPGRIKGLEVAADPGSLCWVELYTTDVPKVAAFYGAVLGLETSAVSFPGGSYTCVNPAGAGDDGMFGGIVDVDDDPAGTGATPHWLPYFEVTDADATVTTAQELGGQVTMPATDMEGVGRIARLTDPYGARFAVIKSATPQT